MKSLPKKTARAWGIMIVLVAVATIAFFILRLQTGTSFRETQIDIGIEHLGRAISEQSSLEFTQAEESFLNASKMSVLDHEAVFLLKTTQRLANVGIQSPKPHDEIIIALRSGKFDEAQRLSESLGDLGTKPRQYYDELIIQLRSN